MAGTADPNAIPRRTAPVVMESTRSRRDSTSDKVAEQLKEVWNRMMLRLSEPPGSVHTSFTDLVRDDVEFAVIRMRYYHRYYPLQTLGAAAGTAFVLGVLLGLGSD